MITILCSGSRGDFQPYIALAQQLKKMGHSVRITAGRSFEGYIRSYGIDVYPISADFQTLTIDPKLLDAAASSDNPIKMLMAFNRMTQYGANLTSQFYSACEGSELIMYPPGCTIGYFAAEEFGIPAVLASPFPINRTSEFLSVVLYGRVPANAVTKPISYALIQGMLWMVSGNSVKAFWKERFGRLPAHFGRPYERHTDERHPAIISCSNHVFKRPVDWNRNIHQLGYWFVEEADEYAPDPRLAEFLAKGEEPVYVGFGSMRGLPDDIARVTIEAIRAQGSRVLVGHGWAGLTQYWSVKDGALVYAWRAAGEQGKCGVSEYGRVGYFERD